MGTRGGHLSTHLGRQGDLIDDVAWSQDLSFDAVVPMIRRLSGEEALRRRGCDDGGMGVLYGTYIVDGYRWFMVIVMVICFMVIFVNGDFFNGDVFYRYL